MTLNKTLGNSEIFYSFVQIFLTKVECPELSAVYVTYSPANPNELIKTKSIKFSVFPKLKKFILIYEYL